MSIIVSEEKDSVSEDSENLRSHNRTYLGFDKDWGDKNEHSVKTIISKFRSFKLGSIRSKGILSSTIVPNMSERPKE